MSEKLVFEVGQEWSFQTRPHEMESTFIITRIDQGGPKGKIVHIYVKGLKMKNKLSATGFNDHIVHLPCSEKALLASGLKLKNERVPLPNFMEGYLSWLKGFEQNKAGVFKLPLAESIAFLETMFRQITTCCEPRKTAALPGSSIFHLRKFMARMAHCRSTKPPRLKSRPRQSNTCACSSRVNCGRCRRL